MTDPGDDHTDVLRGLVAERMPDYPFRYARPLGEGLDNVAFLVNDELVLRFGKQEDAVPRAAAVRRETAVLTAIAALCPVPVPAPVFTVPEHGCLAYFVLPGVPLRAVADAPAAVVGGRLGDVLLALHSAPVESLATLVDADDFPLGEWLAEAARRYADLGEHVPAHARAPIRDFLRGGPPDDTHTPVFSHNDLGSEHVLVDPDTGEVTGIIDWTDAAIGDPAYDFGLILRDLGPAGLDAALRGYQDDGPALRARAACYARCTVLDDLEFGLENDRQDYVATSLAAIDRLFSP